MKQRLINHIQSVTDPALRRTCESILTYDKFFTWPASLSHHHAYEGGLLAHTVEVCDIAMGISISSSGIRAAGINQDILIAATLWHDVMKTEEYLDVEFDETVKYKLTRKHPDMQPMTMWIKDETRVKMFGHHEHIIAGAMEFAKWAACYCDVSNTDTIDAVTHCILAHHGRKEWGSPVEPQTIEALILHQADMLSAQYGATKEVTL